MNWSRSRFADLSPDTVGASTAQSDTNGPGVHTNGRTRRRAPRNWLIGGGLVVSVVVTGLVIVGSCGGDRGDDHGTSVTVRVAHGPTGVINGVPVGYTHDREGAATAAVNTVQALTQAGQGRITMSAVESALLARDPSPHLRRSIQIGRDRPAQQDVINLVPAAVSVTTFTERSARVMVWTMTVSRGSITQGDRISVITAWSTHTVDLVWEGQDWRAKEAIGQAGPIPEDAAAPGADSPLAQPLQSGYYSVYIN